MQVQVFAFMKLCFVNVHQNDPFVSAGFCFPHFVYFSAQLAGLEGDACCCGLQESKAVLRLFVGRAACLPAGTRSQRSHRNSLPFRKGELSRAELRSWRCQPVECQLP